MIIHCINNQSIGEPEKYILNFIFDNCGFFVKWINTPSDVFLNINYGNNGPLNHKNQIHLLKQYSLITLDKEDLKWDDFNIDGTIVPVLGIQNVPEDLTIPFDIVATIYFHIVCIEEVEYNHPNDVDNNVAQRILYNYGNFKIPFVDIIINWFSKKVQEIAATNGNGLIIKSKYPANEAYGIAITHDVDFTRTLHPLKLAGYKVLRFLFLLSKDRLNQIKENNNSKWPFKNLLNLYAEKKWTVTFNFIARYVEGFHFRYRIKSKRIFALLSDIKKSGHEIGLHPSKYAFENNKRYEKELLKLKSTINNPVYGMRHHYLRTLFPDIWKIADDSNILYDSTMAFRRYPGFRAGTSFPFIGFDHKNQLLLNCTEFPTLFYEGSLPLEDEKKSVFIINNLFQNVESNTGLLTLLWHTNNMVTPESYKRIWEHLIKKISDKAVYIASLKGHLDWLNFRNSINITSVNTKDKTTEVVIHKPQGFTNFALKMIHNTFSIHNAEYQEKDSSIIIKSKYDAEQITLRISQ